MKTFFLESKSTSTSRAPLNAVFVTARVLSCSCLRITLARCLTNRNIVILTYYYLTVECWQYSGTTPDRLQKTYLFSLPINSLYFIN